MDEKVVYSFPKGRRSEVRAVLREYQGHELAEIRTFYLDMSGNGTDCWEPTPRGVAVPRAQAHELLRAAQALVAEVERQDAGDDTAPPDVRPDGEGAEGSQHCR